MPQIDVALVYRDGRKEVVSVGRPVDLIAFADKFEKAAPSEPHAVYELAWLAHHALNIEQPLEEWIAGLDDLTSGDERVAEIKAELADPTGAADEAATPTALSPVDPPATERGIESLG